MRNKKKHPLALLFNFLNGTLVPLFKENNIPVWVVFNPEVYKDKKQYFVNFTINLFSNLKLEMSNTGKITTEGKKIDIDKEIKKIMIEWEEHHYGNRASRSNPFFPYEGIWPCSHYNGGLIEEDELNRLNKKE